MRSIWIAAGLALALAGTASANTINFGAIADLSTCSLSGNAADRSCTRNATTNNGANDGTASAQVTGQSSADSILGSSTDTADMTIRYRLPYTVTRTVTWAGPNLVNVPTQIITFNATWTGALGVDNALSSAATAQSFTASLSSLGGNFATANYGTAGTRNTSGTTPFNVTVPDPSFSLSQGSSVGEISFVFQVPATYNIWADMGLPYALDYTNGFAPITQSFSDTLEVSIRLLATSPGGTFVNGGEAIACFGEKSPLGSFDVDNSLNCGSGFQLTATSAVTGGYQFIAPEPGSALLLGLGLAGLAAARLRAAS